MVFWSTCGFLWLYTLSRALGAHHLSHLGTRLVSGVEAQQSLQSPKAFLLSPSPILTASGLWSLHFVFPISAEIQDRNYVLVYDSIIYILPLNLWADKTGKLETKLTVLRVFFLSTPLFFCYLGVQYCSIHTCNVGCSVQYV